MPHQTQHLYILLEVRPPYVRLSSVVRSVCHNFKFHFPCSYRSTCFIIVPSRLRHALGLTFLWNFSFFLPNPERKCKVVAGLMQFAGLLMLLMMLLLKWLVMKPLHAVMLLLKWGSRVLLYVVVDVIVEVAGDEAASCCPQIFLQSR